MILPTIVPICHGFIVTPASSVTTTTRMLIMNCRIKKNQLRRPSLPSKSNVEYSDQQRRERTTSTKESFQTDDANAANFAGRSGFGLASDSLLRGYSQSNISTENLPPSLSIIRRNFSKFVQGGNTDIRGQYVATSTPSTTITSASAANNKRRTSRVSFTSLAHAIIRGHPSSLLPSLTSFEAYCFGYAFATQLVRKEQQQRTKEQQQLQQQDDDIIVICVGRDPRPHGKILADAFAQGASSASRSSTSSSTSSSNIDQPQQPPYPMITIKVVSTGLATTPAMYEFCRSSLCHGGVMVTASHLPIDRNGFKFFTTHQGGYTQQDLITMIELSQDHAQTWFDRNMLPQIITTATTTTTSPPDVYDSNSNTPLVDWMPYYEQQLKNVLLSLPNPLSTTTTTTIMDDQYHMMMKKPLEGLTIVLNAGNGSGGFFQKVLQDLGANGNGSIHITPDPTFPQGIPNPEYPPMIQQTIQACQDAHADLGIMLDTDADRCGLVAPRTYSSCSKRNHHENHNDPSSSSSTTSNQDSYHSEYYIPTDYEPLNRNRLIALMGVIYARQEPGCAIVTDSVTSTGLTTFLQNNLGLHHIRYKRGYANVIQKAKQWNIERKRNKKNGIQDADAAVAAAAEEVQGEAHVAIETSGHCALKENGFLDDGTYTAVKVLGLLAHERQKEHQQQQQQNINSPPSSLLDLIASLRELDEVVEFRLPVLDGTSVEESMLRSLFDFVALEIEALCEEGKHEWIVDRDNWEGIRVSTGSDGGYFLLRKSLHDPIFCLHVEATSRDKARHTVVQPLLQLFQSKPLYLANTLNLASMEVY